MYNFHNSTDTLKFWTEKRDITKPFFVFHPILMKLGEIVVHLAPLAGEAINLKSAWPVVTFDGTEKLY